MNSIYNSLTEVLCDITNHLEKGIIPFWTNNAIDREYGGYITCFDKSGRETGDKDKYIVTQTRMIWGLSAYYRYYPEKKNLIEEAKQGVDFLIKYFWDKNYGGWYWKVGRTGTLIDDGKIVYGQSFAIYALSEYSIASGNPIGLEYASNTFDLLQKYCVDTYNGGYYENFEYNWVKSGEGYEGGDRKTLDVHMHLMEAFTNLYKCSNEQIHRRKLEEIISIILNRMIDRDNGCGFSQFDSAFNPIPAIDVKRTWNSEREKGAVNLNSIDTTSYGHNVEFAWLLNKASEILGKKRDFYDEIIRKIVDHCIKYGIDHQYGGVYRDGPFIGEAIVKDKEWWQNCEVLVGLLEAFEKFGDKKYFEAFLKTWYFNKKYMINDKVGEWRQLLDRKGNIIIDNIGNPWKAIYHTGRAMLECKLRLERLCSKFSA